MTVGERIRELRKRRKMSPVQLAAAAGVTDSAIHQLEDGMTKSPSFANGLRIARALGVSPYELAFGERGGDVAVPTDLAQLTRRMEVVEEKLGIKRRRS
jgi:transcriptional regulator with XRE-family HTH domain